MSPYSIALTYRGHTERADAYVVSGNFFETLGVKPALGRTLEPADTTAPGGAPVVVLSYGCWKNRFGSNPGILNQGILVNNKPMTVVGVTDSSFEGTQPGYDSRTLSADYDALVAGCPGARSHASQRQLDQADRPHETRACRCSRLPPDCSPPSARFYAMSCRSSPAGTTKSRRHSSRARSFSAPGARGRPQLMHDSGNQVIALMSMVGLVLLIACANIAGLLTARAASRQREIGIRLSLGASRFQLVRQLLIESILLGGAGAVARTC